MNISNPRMKLSNRQSIRLKGYDYSQAGAYFVTICVKNRECLFGHIADGEMILNHAGQLIESEWLKLPERFTNIELHEYIVMPNHFHAILQIAVGATLVVAQNTGKTVGDMVGSFKSITTVEYIRNVKNNGWERFNGKLWQRNYWEHIVRNENEYLHISQYIKNNPKKWDLDKLNGGSGNIIME